MRRALCAAAVALIAMGCTTDTDTAASASCSAFRSTAADARMLTGEELREEIQRVRRMASVSESPRLRQLGDDLLIEVTSGTDEGFATAIRGFAAECERLGY